MTCVHRWICGDPRGGEVPAHCRECGAERIFRPGLFDADWNYPHSKNYVRHAKPDPVMLGDEVLR